LFAEGRLEINVQAAETALATHLGERMGLNATQVAHGISEIVDENMAGAGRMHAVESGKDLNARLMIAFGGNGPLHATRVARRAQVDRIVIPRDPGVGSAVGFLFAPVSFEIVRSRYATLTALDVNGLNAFFDDMIGEAQSVVRAGVPDGPLTQRRVGFMRYHGQGHEIEIPLPDRALAKADIPALRAAFEAEYSRQFSRVPETTTEQEAKPTGVRQIFCDVTGALREAVIYERSTLCSGDKLKGPALIVEPQTTTFVSADFDARVDAAGNLWLRRKGETSDD
jgi:N-methylhydantoinase A